MVKSEANQYLALGCETQNNRDFNTDRSIQVVKIGLLHQ